MIVVIDGPAGTGKSTVAKKVAEALGFTFFDTGAMYRALAWLSQERQIDGADRESICALLPSFHFMIKTDGEEKRYFVGENDVTQAIRVPGISSVASQIAAYPEVRNTMVQIQRKLALGGDAVFEGRDMGTTVFPDADLKFFLTAKPEVRATRRLLDLKEKFPEENDSFRMQQVLKEIQERDLNDATRTASPLKQAENAHLIDTSEMTIDEVVEKILHFVAQKCLYPRKSWFYACVYWMARLFFKICFRLQIHGLNHFHPGAGIVIANHVSNYDPPVLSVSCPEEVHFLAKESLFNIPFLGRIIRLLNAHPIARSVSDVSVLRDLIALLQSGKKVILFPEGARSADGKLQPLQRGLSLIFKQAKCPIFPAYIHGTYDAWPVHKKRPKFFGKMSVTFGEPIEWREFEGLDKQLFAQKFNERVTSSLQVLEKSINNFS